MTLIFQPLELTNPKHTKKMIQTINDNGSVTEMMRRIDAMFQRAKARNYVVENTLSAGSFKERTSKKPQRTLREIRAMRAKVLELHDLNYGPWDISIATGCGKSAVYHMVENERKHRESLKRGQP